MIKPQRLSVSSGVRTSGIVIGVIFVLYAAREIVVPLAFAITLALILNPAVAWLEKIRVGRAAAVALIMMITIAATGGTAWVIFDELVDVANELPRYQQNIDSKLKALRTPGKGALGRATASVQQLGKELAGASAPLAGIPAARIGRKPETPPARPLAVQVVAEPANELEYVRDVATPILRPLGLAGIVLLFSVFLLTKQNDLRNRLFRLVGLDQLNLMTQALDDATRRVSRYLLMQFLVNSAFGALCGAGLYLIGIPYAVLWGCVAAILRLVPYVGVMVAASLPLMLSLAVFDHWTPPVLVFLMYAALELVTGNFIEPTLYGAHTGISALALLLTTVFWTALWGSPGLILSTPLTVCVVVLGRYVPQFSFLHIILGDETVLEPEARIYQRLLAMDDREARAVADLYLDEHPLAELYDAVIVPALSMAEQDRHKGSLEPVRRDFLFLSIKEMVVEYSEKFAAAHERPGQEVTSTGAGRIFVVPANDEADEIAAAMLAQLLDQAGYAAIPFPVDFGRDERIGIVAPNEADVFCVSALPPFAFAGAITLVRQLQLRFPRTRVIVGVWGFAGNPERALQRFQQSQPHCLVTSLAAAVRYVADKPLEGVA